MYIDTLFKSLLSFLHFDYEIFYVLSRGYFISNSRGGASKVHSSSSGCGIFVENVYPVSGFSFILGGF